MNVKTIALSGAEMAVSVGGSHAEVKNNGTDIIYSSANSGIVAGADGVVSIPAGSAVTVLDTRGEVYLLGTGGAEIVGKDFVSQVFKPAATSGGGTTEDEVARNAISAHSGNAGIHVTAEEKTEWNAKANKSDIPTSLPANGGNADAAREILSPNAKAKLWEDPEGGNLRLVSPDGNHSVEMDLYNNEGFRMYFTDNGELTFPVDYNFTTKKFNINGDAVTLDGLHASDFAHMTNVIGGLRRGWASTDIGTIITYNDREVVKSTDDLTYFGWSTDSDGWFFPIIVSQYPSGTKYTMFNNKFGYGISQDSDCSSFAYKGRTYYACWSNGGAYNNPTVVGGLYLALTNNDFISACKTLIDACEAIDADTLDGKHASDFVLKSDLSIVSDTDDNTTKTALEAKHGDILVRLQIQTDVDTARIFKSTDGGTTWDEHNVADGGNAASVGAYTEEKIAALEARIAALEGK